MSIKNQIRAESATKIRARIKPRWKHTITFVRITLRLQGETVFEGVREVNKFVQLNGAVMKKLADFPEAEVKLNFFEA